MNKVILMGRLTKDPELTTTTSGVSVAKFTLAVQRQFRNAEGEYDTDFINCVAWRTNAEFIDKYFKKGERMLVSGTMQVRSYEANDGTKRYVTEVVVNETHFIEIKGNQNNNDSKLEPIDEIDDDNLPF